MGTRVSLTFYIEDEAVAADAAKAVFDRLAAIEDVISDWRTDSEIMKAQGRPIGTSGPISTDLARLLDLSLLVARQSGGAFDVTCGATTRLWRRARQSGVVPSEAEMTAAAATCDYRQIILGEDSHGPTLQINQAGLEFDFGGIGKGFGADEALAVLEGRGISSALVDFGGDMALGQPPPDRSGWRIELPDSQVHLLSSCGIATSGATEQFMLSDGKRLSHLINPETGEAVLDRGEVTVLAPNAALADAWASVVLVTGIEQARLLADPESGVQFLVPSRD